MELLAPAGNMEKMKMALLYGADGYIWRAKLSVSVRTAAILPGKK